LSRPLEWPRAVSSLAPCYFYVHRSSPALTKSDAAPGARHRHRVVQCGSSGQELRVARCAGGDPQALRIWIERILPARRNRPIEISLPKIADASDLIAAAAALTDAVARGDITPNEASALSNLVGNTAKAIETFELSERLAPLGRLRP
jgi:hypothetical protein